jgi:hypothetical protein
MSFQLTPVEDLSLHHVLENGLALLRHQKLPARRRSEVLDSLARIFSEAGSGSRAVHAQNLLAAIEQRPALDRFTLFFRYLHSELGETLPQRVEEAATVLDKLRSKRTPTAASVDRTRELIERLLVAIGEERSLTPLEPPRSFLSLS